MEIRDLLNYILEYAEKKGAEFVEARFQDKYSADLVYKNGEINTNIGSRNGIGIRVLVDGSWAFASTNKLSKENAEEIVSNAVSLAKNSASSKSEKIQLAEVEIIDEKAVSPRKISLLDISLEEKIKMIQEASKLKNDYSAVKSLQISYNEVIDKRIIFTNEGTRVEWEDMKPTVISYAVASKEGKIAGGYKSWSHTCGAEFFDLHPLDELVKSSCEKSTQLTDATLPPAGIHNLLLDHQMVGVLAHEAIGHTAEADLVLAGSFTQGKLGKKVCDERITIVDSPFKESTNWMGVGWLPFDDEGVKGKEVKIITNGVMTGYMTNRELATKLGVEPTGNARAYTFADEPIVRMRNTYIESGDMSFEELLEAIGDGYYLKSLQNGQADSSGEFMFGALEAFRITKGEITDEIFQGPVLTGNAFEVLSNIIGVGKDFVISLGSGSCGKIQPAKVDAGGPHIAVKAMLAGGN
ncbi:MAG: TldD/PmbA family protein [Candidatus Heimdallarchaeaceae archaeon]